MEITLRMKTSLNVYNKVNSAKRIQGSDGSIKLNDMQSL